MVNEISTAKAIGSVGLYATLVALLDDAQMMSLLITGIVVGSASYYHDWAHDENRVITAKEIAELIKAVIYAVAGIYIVFYVLVALGQVYVVPRLGDHLPYIVHGSIAVLMAGKAVTIVQWITSRVGDLVDKVFVVIGGKIK